MKPKAFHRKFICTAGIVFLMSSILFAQKTITAHINLNDKRCKKCSRILDDYKRNPNPDSISLIFVECLRSGGYISASVDSVTEKNDSVHLYVYTGLRYKWKNITLAEHPDTLLPVTMLSTKHFKNKYVDFYRYRQFLRKLVLYYENSGYPFAIITNDSIRPGENLLSLHGSVSRGMLFRFDSVDVTGTGRISKKYLQRYLEIIPGNIYSEKKFRQIPSKVNELSFIKQEKSPEVFFLNDKAIVRLFLKNRKSNHFNGILGIMPDSKNNGKINLTGDISVKLVNSFRHDDEITFIWKKTGPLSQNLFISAGIPYIFNKPFGADASFKLYKKDSSYVNYSAFLGLPLYFSGRNSFGLFYENSSSTILSTVVVSPDIMPQTSGYTSNMAGFTLIFSHSDYKLNPRKGLFINLKSGFGRKTLEKNPGINPAVYQNVNLASFRNEASSDIKLFYPVYQKLVLKLRGQSGYINTRNLVRNELFRLGGFSTLRGFDEESIYASAYYIATCEFRYLFEENSAFFIFYDKAGYQSIDNVNDSPYGLGAGIELQSKAGIFTLSYALGKQFDNPVELRNARIHFGFINRF